MLEAVGLAFRMSLRPSVDQDLLPKSLIVYRSEASD